MSLNFGVKAPRINDDVIEASLQRFDVFDDVVLNVSEWNQLKIFVLATVFAPTRCGALNINIGNLNLLFLFNFEAYRNLLGNSRFAWAAFRAANHNDLGHWRVPFA
ncbi:Uncharacterised protein [Salmonella enterica subsp. enterica serovar Typhi]|nr:Uncharacterised protein [Salmonella enterica subsp. enterica serovar Typhi]